MVKSAAERRAVAYLMEAHGMSERRRGLCLLRQLLQCSDGLNRRALGLVLIPQLGEAVDVAGTLRCFERSHLSVQGRPEPLWLPAFGCGQGDGRIPRPVPAHPAALE